MKKKFNIIIVFELVMFSLHGHQKQILAEQSEQVRLGLALEKRDI